MEYKVRLAARDLLYAPSHKSSRHIPQRLLQFMEHWLERDLALGSPGWVELTTHRSLLS